MSFDPAKTLDLVKMGLTDPAGAWQKHFGEGANWQDTALVLTLPLIVVYALLFALFGGFGGLGGSFFGMLFSTLLSAIIGLTLAAY